MSKKAKKISFVLLFYYLTKMTYQIYNHSYSKDQLTCVYYDPDERQTFFTFCLGHVRKFEFNLKYYILFSPTYIYAKEREVTYLVKGKVDVPHSLQDKETFVIASPDEILSISYTDKERDDYTLSLAYYVLPFVEKTHREIHTVDYK